VSPCYGGWCCGWPCWGPCSPPGPAATTTIFTLRSGWRDGNHIRIDLLSRFLPAGAGRLLRRLTDLFSALVCALLAWHAGRFVYADWQDGMEWISGIPSWSVELIIPIGFGVMALRFGLQTLTGPPTETERP